METERIQVEILMETLAEIQVEILVKTQETAPALQIIPEESRNLLTDVSALRQDK